MNLKPETEQVIRRLISEQKLPEQYFETAVNVILPLAGMIASRKKTDLFFACINGAQGTGKSTMASFLSAVIETEYKMKAAVLSLDDFYLTRKERKSLSETVHPLLMTRGVPGTHDLELMNRTFSAIEKGKICPLPSFDKSIDDRKERSLWKFSPEKTDAVIFEGWCVSSPFQSSEELQKPVNELEEKEDPEGIWRRYANEKLKEYHRHIFDRSNLTVMLNPGSFERIFEWRSLQEQKLREKTGNSKNLRIMNEHEIRRFIQHYERISRHTLKFLPDSADIVCPVNEDHSIHEMKVKEK